MSVVFHVGTHKTATTSLQRYFAANRASLKEHNVIYPNYPDLIPVSTSHYAHLDLAKSINGGSRVKFSEPEVLRMFDSINQIQMSK